eukprot:1145043-Pelagomonas_calceolata.AAC.1
MPWWAQMRRNKRAAERLVPWWAQMRRKGRAAHGLRREAGRFKAQSLVLGSCFGLRTLAFTGLTGGLRREAERGHQMGSCFSEHRRETKKWAANGLMPWWDHPMEGSKSERGVRLLRGESTDKNATARATE